MQNFDHRSVRVCQPKSVMPVLANGRWMWCLTICRQTKPFCAVDNATVEAGSTEYATRLSRFCPLTLSAESILDSVLKNNARS